jgi:hypothetical protein
VTRALVTVLLACVVAPRGAWAQESSGAASASEDAPKVVRLVVGQPAPFDGLLLADARAVEQARRVVAAEAQVKALEAKLAAAPSWWWVPVAGLVGLGIGLGLGVGLGLAAGGR